jgi:hypothetical protein
MVSLTVEVDEMMFGVMCEVAALEGCTPEQLAKGWLYGVLERREADAAADAALFERVKALPGLLRPRAAAGDGREGVIP